MYAEFDQPRFRLRRWPKLRRLLLSDREAFVRLRSLRPSLGPYGPEWPTMLVENRCGQRMTVTPVWNLARLREAFFDVEGGPIDA